MQFYDRLDGEDADLAAPGDELFLARAMALDFGRGTFDTQQLGRQAEAGAVVELDLENALGLFVANLDRPVLGVEALVHGAGPSASSRRRASSASMIGIPSRIG